MRLRHSVALALSYLAIYCVSCEGAAPSLSTANLPASLGGVSAVAADNQGNIYLTGITTGGLPVTPGAAQAQYGGGGNTCGELEGFQMFPCTDAFVAKIKASTGAVVWATYLGGDANDGGTSIAVDAAGNVYVTGYTNGDFPVTPGAYIANAGPGMFVTKVSADGSRFLYSTHIPGEVPALGTRVIAPVVPSPAIAVDSEGDAYVTGQTAAGSAGSGAFVIKLNPEGSAALYNTTLAGSNPNTVIAVDTNGNAYVTGSTVATSLPVTPGAAQTKLAGQQNAFVEKLSMSGAVVMATYLGGSQSDQGTAIGVDSSGYIYVAGFTSSFNFPTTPGAYLPQAALPPSTNVPGGFAAKLSSDGALVFSTYIVGNAVNSGYYAVTSMIPDQSGGVYVAGLGDPGLAVTASAPQPCENGEDTVVTHLGANGSLVDRTHFGYPNYSFPIGLVMPAEHSVGLLTQTPVIAQLNFGDGMTPPPSCLSTEVLLAASFSPPSYGGIALGSAITLTGFGLGPETGMTAQLTLNNTLPTEIGGVQVLVNGQAAPLLYVQSEQINAFAPFTLQPETTATVSVTYNGMTIGSTSMPVASGSQNGGSNGAFFRLDDTSTQAAAINQDGTINGPDHPAPVGSVIALYGTGFGQTQLPGVSGTLFTTASPLAATTPLTITMNQIPATVKYAGAAPFDWAGIDQINLQVPAGAVSGANTVSVNPQSGVWYVTIWVQ